MLLLSIRSTQNKPPQLQVLQSVTGYKVSNWSYAVYVFLCVGSCGIFWLIMRLLGPSGALWTMHSQCPLGTAQYVQVQVKARLIIASPLVKTPCHCHKLPHNTSDSKLCIGECSWPLDVAL